MRRERDFKEFFGDQHTPMSEGKREVRVNYVTEIYIPQVVDAELREIIKATDADAFRRDGKYKDDLDLLTEDLLEKLTADLTRPDVQNTFNQDFSHCSDSVLIKQKLKKTINDKIIIALEKLEIKEQVQRLCDWLIELNNKNEDEVSSDEIEQHLSEKFLAHSRIHSFRECITAALKEQSLEERQKMLEDQFNSIRARQLNGNRQLQELNQTFKNWYEALYSFHEMFFDEHGEIKKMQEGEDDLKEILSKNPLFKNFQPLFSVLEQLKDNMMDVDLFRVLFKCSQIFNESISDYNLCVNTLVQDIRKLGKYEQLKKYTGSDNPEKKLLDAANLAFSILQRSHDQLENLVDSKKCLLSESDKATIDKLYQIASDSFKEWNANQHSFSKGDVTVILEMTPISESSCSDVANIIKKRFIESTKPSFLERALGATSRRNPTTITNPLIISQNLGNSFTASISEINLFSVEITQQNKTYQVTIKPLISETSCITYMSIYEHIKSFECDLKEELLQLNFSSSFELSFQCKSSGAIIPKDRHMGRKLLDDYNKIGSNNTIDITKELLSIIKDLDAKFASKFLGHNDIPSYEDGLKPLIEDLKKIIDNAPFANVMARLQVLADEPGRIEGTKYDLHNLLIQVENLKKYIDVLHKYCSLKLEYINNTEANQSNALLSYLLEIEYLQKEFKFPEEISKELRFIDATKEYNWLRSQFYDFKYFLGLKATEFPQEFNNRLEAALANQNISYKVVGKMSPSILKDFEKILLKNLSNANTDSFFARILSPNEIKPSGWHIDKDAHQNKLSVCLGEETYFSIQKNGDDSIIISPSKNPSLRSSDIYMKMSQCALKLAEKTQPKSPDTAIIKLESSDSKNSLFGVMVSNQNVALAVLKKNTGEYFAHYVDFVETFNDIVKYSSVLYQERKIVDQHSKEITIEDHLNKVYNKFIEAQNFLTSSAAPKSLAFGNESLTLFVQEAALYVSKVKSYQERRHNLTKRCSEIESFTFVLKKEVAEIENEMNQLKRSLEEIKKIPTQNLNERMCKFSVIEEDKENNKLQSFIKDLESKNKPDTQTLHAEFEKSCAQLVLNRNNCSALDVSISSNYLLQAQSTLRVLRACTEEKKEKENQEIFEAWENYINESIEIFTDAKKEADLTTMIPDYKDEFGQAQTSAGSSPLGISVENDTSDSSSPVAQLVEFIPKPSEDNAAGGEEDTQAQLLERQLELPYLSRDELQLQPEPPPVEELKINPDPSLEGEFVTVPKQINDVDKIINVLAKHKKNVEKIKEEIKQIITEFESNKPEHVLQLLNDVYVKATNEELSPGFYTPRRSHNRHFLSIFFCSTRPGMTETKKIHIKALKKLYLDEVKRANKTEQGSILKTTVERHLNAKVEESLLNANTTYYNRGIKESGKTKTALVVKALLGIQEEKQATAKSIP